jgi:hypothetical protein
VIFLSYDNWFSYQLINLINSIEKKQSVEDIKTVIEEIRRGLTYASQNPSSINPLLIRMGEGLMGPVLRTYNLEASTVSKKSEDISIDELKSALGQHQKNKVINKMSGSLSQLTDLEED